MWCNLTTLASMGTHLIENWTLELKTRNVRLAGQRRENDVTQQLQTKIL